MDSRPGSWCERFKELEQPGEGSKCVNYLLNKHTEGAIPIHVGRLIHESLRRGVRRLSLRVSPQMALKLLLQIKADHDYIHHTEYGISGIRCIFQATTCSKLYHTLHVTR